jgi:hypothetical protein
MQSLIAGDTLDYITAVDGFPPADGWTFVTRLLPAFAGSEIILTATPTENDQKYRTQAASGVTADWLPGQYGWASWVEQAGSRQIVEDFSDHLPITIRPNPATLAVGTDTRSAARIAVENLKTAYQTYISTNGHVKAYTIGSRSMTFSSASEILQTLALAQYDLSQEILALSIAASEGHPGVFGVRFSR